MLKPWKYTILLHKYKLQVFRVVAITWCPIQVCVTSYCFTHNILCIPKCKIDLNWVSKLYLIKHGLDLLGESIG